MLNLFRGNYMYNRSREMICHIDLPFRNNFKSSLIGF